MKDPIKVIITEPLASIMDVGLADFDIKPGDTLRLRIGDSVYVFHWEDAGDVLRVSVEKPGTWDLPHPASTTMKVKPPSEFGPNDSLLIVPWD